MADRFARILLCSGADKPCGVCAPCLQLAAGAHPDFAVIEGEERGKSPIGEENSSGDADAGSVRWLVRRLASSPVGARHVVLIDGIDFAEEPAQNALLKTLEEPPAGSVIMLVSSRPGMVLPTIRSRCTGLFFRALSEDEVLRVIDPDAQLGREADLAAALCGGSVARALLLLDGAFRDEVIAAAGVLETALRQGGGAGLTKLEAGVQKYGEALLDVLVETFAGVLRARLRGRELPAGLKLSIDDTNLLRRIIIVLQAVRRAQGRNLRSEYCIRGMAAWKPQEPGEQPPLLTALRPEMFRH